MIREINYYWPILIPLAFSVAAVYFESLIIFGLLVLSVFAVLKFNMAYMLSENIWGFIIVAISFIPVNCYIISHAYEHLAESNTLAVCMALLDAIFYVFLFCVEEIILGTVIRLLWRNQLDI